MVTMTDTKNPDTNSNFTASLEAIATGGYLGSRQLLDELVRGWWYDLMTAASPDDAIAACNRLALVLAGQDPAYTVVPDWNTRAGLGMVVAERIGVDPDQNFVDILRSALAVVGTEGFTLAREYEGRPETDWQWVVDAKIEMLVSLFLGTIDLTHEPIAPAPEGGA